MREHLGVIPDIDWVRSGTRDILSLGYGTSLLPDIASDFIYKEELPVILSAAERGAITLLWVHLAAALYEATPIGKYQAAYDPSRPLAALPRVEQEDALKQIGINIKTAVFDNPRAELERPQAASVSR